MLLSAEVHSAGIQDRDGAALIFNKLVNRFGGYHGKGQKSKPQTGGDRQA